MPTMAKPQKPLSSAVQEVDRVQVVVNHEVITQRELEARLELVTRRLQQTKAPLPPAAHLKLQVLEQMVLERLQLQTAKQEGITVNEETIDRTLEQIAQANRLSLEKYRDWLKERGIAWPIFVTDVKNELILSRLRQKEVDQKITVSDAEVANYLANHQAAESAEKSLPQPEDVRQTLGMHKAEQAYADWLRELRDSSFILYKTDSAAL
ncbi:SurA N-terminal domain-containing protein [Mycoavidus sp. B2-EB]|uniref:SurA N-terminal domain-containing protein n=1 Tax=Mycoavidus sp. B2-EB TaxID=2651972 RepID=UPI0016279331|nr:SurA N-terminal domain-containing protein [Mycoavidus sp. B2-EB]